MSDKPILDRLRALAEANKQLQQFGQGDDNLVHDGATACTHTICQFLSLVWNGTIPTLNEVNRIAGMPANAINEASRKPRGMRPTEFQTFLVKSRIPMKIVRGLPFGKVLEASNNGPVMYAMRYGSAPERTKAHPNGATQRGVPNIRHAVVLLGFLTSTGPDGRPGPVQVFRKEPNHGSPRRPERPPYDTISDRQCRLEYEAYKAVLGEPLYAAIPTRKLQVGGRLPAAPPAPRPPAAPQAPRPPLVLVGLEAFSGTATISGDLHGAVRVSDRKFIRLPNGTPKRVVALGRLEPRLPGPPGDRTNVALIADADEQASILLRADITLTTDAGVVVPPPAQPMGAAPPGPAMGLPHGDAATEGEDVGNDAIPPD